MGGVLMVKRSSIGLKRSMPFHDLVKTESSVAKYRRYGSAKGGSTRLRISRLRRADVDSTTIDMWGLLNPASAALEKLEKSNFDVFIPKAVDMESDVLFVLPPLNDQPYCPWPRPVTSSLKNLCSLSNIENDRPIYSMTSAFSGMRGVTNHAAGARIALSS